MSPLLSHHNLSYEMVAPYLRGYEHSMSIPPEEWAKAESAGLDVGSIVACLEPVASIGAGQEGIGQQTFKVGELGIVVGQDNERPIVTRITGETYELAFLEMMMAHQAQDTRLTGRDFSYVIIEARHGLSEPSSKAVEQLGRTYAQGGSRREKNLDGTGPIDPAASLLTAMGLPLEPSARKQLLDIGLFCYLIFADISESQGTAMAGLKDCFRAILCGSQSRPRQAVPEELPQPLSAGAASAEPAIEQVGADVALSPTGYPTQQDEQPLAWQPPPAAPGRLEEGEPASREELAEATAWQEEEAQDQRGQPIKDDLQQLLGRGGIFSTIAETASGPDEVKASPEPSGRSAAPSPTGTLKPPPGIRVPRPTQTINERPPDRPEPQAPDSTVSKDKNVSTPPDVVPAPQPPPVMPASGSSSAGTWEIRKPSPLPPKPPKPPSAGPAEPAEPASQTKTPERKFSFTSRADKSEDALPPASRATGARPAEGQPGLGLPEAPTVASGMESLMARLEQQVSRAVSKLAQQVDDIHSTLEAELQTRVSKASTSEGEGEENFQSQLERIGKQLDEITEESRLQMSDTSASGRYAIKQLLDKTQSAIDESQRSLLDGLLDACNQVGGEADRLAESMQRKLQDLMEEKRKALSDLIDSTATKLEATSQEQAEKLKARFARLRERMDFEGETISQSFDRHVQSLREDLEAACERACEKLRSSKGEFEQALKQAVAVYAADLSIIAKTMSSTLLLPKLREYRDVLRFLSAELQRQFAEESSAKAEEQIAKLEATRGEIKDALHELLNSSQERMELAGKEHQERLHEIFNETLSHVESSTAQATGLFQEAEDRIAESDTSSRKLVEAFSAEDDPGLTADKQAAQDSLKQLKETARTDLTATIQSRCDQLAQRCEAAQTQLSTSRENKVKSVRDAADQALEQIRSAVQQAFESIQASREKFLE